MKAALRTQIRPAIVAIAIFTLLSGILYPLVITGIAQGIFQHQANGSLIELNGKVVGSELIGQPFDDPRYFWSRPSATTPYPYNAAASSGSNLGPTNPVLHKIVQTRIAALRTADPTNNLSIPIDLVTASGSGLDPDISVAAAYYQVPRVAQARALSEEEVRALVDRFKQGTSVSLLGEPRVNVLLLNLSLDGIK